MTAPSLRLVVGLLTVSLLFLSTASSESTNSSSNNNDDDDAMSALFSQWLRIHRPQQQQPAAAAADTTDAYYAVRLGIFRDNVRRVDEHNLAYAAGLTTYRMSVEQSPFADLTDAEFATSFLMESQDCSATTTTTTLRPASLLTQQHTLAQSTSLAVDWRTRGIMTPVKNQGHCGSCWTFSTTGCLEAHLCLAHGKDCTHWTGLAEQQLIDCAGAYNNFGCNGGLPSQAFEYIKYNGGIDAEDEYAYTANATGACHAAADSSRSAAPVGHVAEVFNITRYDEDDLVYAIANVGPVSIAYQVSPDFRFYSHGVYDAYNATSGTVQCQNQPHDVNHAVVAVGLGTTADKNVPYYIVRNSWGTLWGMEGHFWMQRGENLCGVSDCASFPLVPTSSSLRQQQQHIGTE